eukprot:1138045-Rhodomonas_salina.2
MSSRRGCSTDIRGVPDVLRRTPLSRPWPRNPILLPQRRAPPSPNGPLGPQWSKRPPILQLPLHALVLDRRGPRGRQHLPELTDCVIRALSRREQRAAL